MIEQLLPFLQNNEFLTGGAALMLLAYARNVPLRLWTWLKRRLFLDVEIQMRDDAFIWISDWLSEQPYTKKWSRGLCVRTVKGGHKKPPRVILSPAPGTHFLFWRGYFLVVRRSRDNNNGNTAPGIFIPKEEFHISIFTPRRKANAIVELLKEARDVTRPPDDNKVSIHTPDYGDWRESSKCRPRPLHSVILREGVMESLVADVEWFLKSEDWFVERGIPYRRGYLLHGPPGNGKSSIVVALASHFGLDVCAINLGSRNLGDDGLNSLLTAVPKHSIVLTEDIDCVFEQRDKTKDNSSIVTFSGLLNAVDGVMASEGRLLFMSTNHIDKLDPALIRPGRCDLQVEIKTANADQARQLFLQFFPDEHELSLQFAEKAEGKSMAALQGHLLQYSCCPAEAVHHD